MNPPHPHPHPALPLGTHPVIARKRNNNLNSHPVENNNSTQSSHSFHMRDQYALSSVVGRSRGGLWGERRWLGDSGEKEAGVRLLEGLSNAFSSSSFCIQHDLHFSELLTRRPRTSSETGMGEA